MSLTRHQQAVLTYIIEFQRELRYSPSLADIASAFDRSKTAAEKAVSLLAKYGCIERGPNGQILFPIKTHKFPVFSM